MLEEATGITLLGANFKNNTKLQFFRNSGIPKISLLYGKNGSGKSTVSRAYNTLKGDTIPAILNAELIDKDGNIISVNEDETKQIYVFNEDYIKEKINFDYDGLNTIIILGEQNNIEDMLKKAREKEKSIKIELEKQEKECLKYFDNKNEKAPDYYLNKMMTALRGDGNWAVRKQRILGSATAAKVTKDTYKQFIPRKPKKSRDELIVEYEKEFDNYQEAKSGAKTINEVIEVPPTIDFDIKKYTELLGKKIERPELTSREKYILQLLAENEYGKDHVLKIRFFASDRKDELCPYCLQTVTKEYKNELCESISKALNKESEEHRQELERYRLYEIEYDLSSYDKLDDEIRKACLDSISTYNENVKKINGYIDIKLQNIYEPVSVEKNIFVVEKHNEVVKALDNLEKARNEYNKAASNPLPIMNKLNEINDDIAYYDIVGFCRKYDVQVQKKKEEEEKKDDLKSVLETITNQVRNLEARKRDVFIARDDINAGLKYIFFESGRLSIEFRDNQYVVLSRGDSVKPKDISVGERNAIGLCYFFSDIMRGREQREVYDGEYLLVIDDPISSFDIENKVGILSLVKYYISRFIIGNPETKVLIMTHDLQSYYDIDKLLGEIVKASKEKYGGRCTGKITYLELYNQDVNTIKKNRGHEYTYLIETMYDYAKGMLPAMYLDVGNAMRRVVEAFSTFEFKQGIAELSTKAFLLDRIESDNRRDYFEHLMYRIVLNEESHTQDSVMSLTSMDYFNYISDDEKQRTAKDILCLLYSLNKEHIEAHLKDRANAVEDIIQWLSDIENE